MTGIPADSPGCFRLTLSVENRCWAIRCFLIRRMGSFKNVNNFEKTECPALSILQHFLLVLYPSSPSTEKAELTLSSNKKIIDKRYFIHCEELKFNYNKSQITDLKKIIDKRYFIHCIKTNSNSMTTKVESLI